MSLRSPRAKPWRWGDPTAPTPRVSFLALFGERLLRFRQPGLARTLDILGRGIDALALRASCFDRARQHRTARPAHWPLNLDPQGVLR